MIYMMLLLIFILMFKFKNNFLMMLISMEFMVMTVLMFIFMNEMYFNEWMFIYYLIFSVCESVIGLSILINLINLYGNQSITLLNLLW